MIKDFSFAQRTQWAFHANPFIERLNRLKENGTPLLDLTESNPTRCGFPYSASKVIADLVNPNNCFYEPSERGLLMAREAISGYYQKKDLSVPSEKIFLTSSTSEAYSFLFRLLINPGEKVLVPRPSYPLFDLLGDLNDAHVDHYDLVYQDGWGIDPEALRKAVGPQTRALICVHPNNPTGSFLKESERSAVNQICKEHRLTLICDEVFLDFQFNRNPEIKSLVNNNEVLTFVLGGISKSLGLPQMKLAWFVANGPEPLLKESLLRLEIIADTYLSVNTPAQHALPSWLNLQRQVLQEIQERLQKNYQFLTECLRSCPGVRCLKIEGGWYAVLRLPAEIHESAWAMNLLEEDHVFVHPGYLFNFTDEPVMVISLLTPEEVFHKGLSCICDRLKKEAS